MESSRPSLADASAQTTVGHPSGDAPLPAATPARLDRYVVVEQVGAGGMGRVLRAYDPKLRREVALKLLTTGAHGSDARIVREAQAMARLSHPNLVPVYDVEHDDAAVFIVMEYVEGDTLRTWIARTPRSWREVVTAFLGAGRGLAAAHAAGVVHRDFKPDNAMVGADGRVRVMDFGLARGVESSEPEHTHALERDGAGLSELTEAGTILGTAPYMAPEQHRGEGSVPATDQYAFCIALYEALFGMRPFAGTDAHALAQAKQRGVPQEPGGAALDVPHWLRVAVIRGLAVLPADRWPSMDALLATLERGQARVRRRRAIVAAAAIGLAVAGVALVARLDYQRRVAACDEAGASIGAVWNDDVRMRVHDGLVASGVGYAETTALKVMPWLDAQAHAWQSARTEACLDADVRAVIDDTLLDRSLWCLDEHQLALEALIAELSRADATIVQRAVTAAAGLGSVGECRDADLLERLPAPPVERREEVRQARAEVARALTLDLTGEYARSLEVARAARERADELGWPPLSAAARAREARSLERGGEYQASEELGTAAYFEAARIGAWDVAAVAASNLVFVVGERRARLADGLAWGRHAEVALAHAADISGLREASRLNNVANVHHALGDYEQARTLKERALELREIALGPEHPDVASSLNNLALTHQAMGEYARARALLERALAISERALGPDHPEIATHLNNLGTLALTTGDYAEARARHERALAIWETAFGPDHPDVGTSLSNLASVDYSTGDFERARARLERAVEIQERTLGLDHPDLAMNLDNLGSITAALGDYPQARALHERALRSFERTLGAEHRLTASSTNNLANVYYAIGDYQQARALHLRALEIREKLLGRDHPEVATSLQNLGQVHRALHEYAQARPLYERSLAIRERALGADHAAIAQCLASLGTLDEADDDDEGAVRRLERAVTIFDGHEGIQEGEPAARFALARVLVATKGDRTRARRLAEQARDDWRTDPASHPRELAEVDRWLASTLGADRLDHHGR